MTRAAVPRYRQLKELIIRRISTGELQPRDRVSSENELVDSTGVSRMTANRALRELTDEGYLERIAGVGLSGHLYGCKIGWQECSKWRLENGNVRRTLPDAASSETNSQSIRAVPSQPAR